MNNKLTSAAPVTANTAAVPAKRFARWRPRARRLAMEAAGGAFRFLGSTACSWIVWWLQHR
ncbi:hypothetical protein [Kitasatospora cineracea]|uniref:Uncharacterized protein n=1 Tax=Kitasatospora cineracea TaxID=88074 RepID=A0A8G1UH79_9ACTN|nr:hypothetical protein [Kitasatospora cineracea]ROR42989.1 hypothetical protein EDD39_1124 [Kitasatospora cineracea]